MEKRKPNLALNFQTEHLIADKNVKTMHTTKHLVTQITKLDKQNCG